MRDVLIDIQAKLRQGAYQGERQLRDYNRNMTALFCVLTDGRMWRFYLSHTSGDFASKCFKTLDLLSANADDSEAALTAYLSKAAIASGQAKKSAEILLDLTKKERAMEECLPQARRRTQDPPYPSLPDALVSLVADQGFEITRQEAEEFIARSRREVGVIAPPLNADGGPPPPPPPPPASAASSAATCARTSD